MMSCFCICLSAEVLADEIRRTRIMMGTSVSITIDQNSYETTAAIDIAFREIARIEQILSTYVSDSHISKLNRLGRLSYPPIELHDVISRGLYFGLISDGAFDITIKPVLDLYRECIRTKQRPPTAIELAVTTALVNYRNVAVHGDCIQIQRRGTQITTDGIAKGYIIDRAIAVLERNGVESALINIGGDARAMGRRSNGLPWIIALQNPRDQEVNLAIIPLQDKAVATSGDYERYFVPEKTIHHIVDPRTGHSATSLISSTVIAKTAIDADALATTVFVMGPEKGMSLVESINDVEALVVTRGFRVLKSSGLTLLTESFKNPITQD